MSGIKITKDNINWSHIGWDEYSVSKGNYADESTIKKDYWGNKESSLEAVPVEVDGKEVYRIDEVDKNGNRTGMGFIDKEGMKTNGRDKGYPSSMDGVSKTNGRDKGYPSSMDGISETNTKGYERAEESFQSTSNQPKNAGDEALKNIPSTNKNIEKGFDDFNKFVQDQNKANETKNTSSEEKVDLVDESNNNTNSKTNTKGYERAEESFQSTSNQPKSTENNSKSASQDEIYIVKSGDTLSAIASKYGLDYKELAEYNNISNPSIINVNQEIKIPGANSKQPAKTSQNQNTNNKSIDYEKIKNVDIKNIAKMNEEEIKSAEAAHISDTTYMALNNVDVNGYNMKIAHVYITDPSQLKCIQSQSNEGENITSLAKRTAKPVIGTVGGFFKSGSNRQNLEGTTNRVYILNGELADTCNIHNITSENVNDAMNTTVGGQKICIDKNGKIFYAPKGATAKQLIEDYNVVNTFTSHEARRIDNGEVIQTVEWDKGYDRTYLCMKKPGEYYILQGYCTPGAVTNYAKDVLGVEFCGSLEQGSATAMNINGETVRNHEGYDGVGNAFFVTD